MRFSPTDIDPPWDDNNSNNPLPPRPNPNTETERVPGQITYAEFLLRCEQNGMKARPIGAFEPGGYLGPSRST